MIVLVVSLIFWSLIGLLAYAGLSYMRIQYGEDSPEVKAALNGMLHWKNFLIAGPTFWLCMGFEGLERLWKR